MSVALVRLHIYMSNTPHWNFILSTIFFVTILYYYIHRFASLHNHLVVTKINLIKHGYYVKMGT